MSALDALSVQPSRIKLRALRLGPLPMAAFCIVAGVYLVLLLGELLHWGGTRGLQWCVDTGWTLGGTLATASCLYRALRQHGRARTVWLLFAAGCAAWLIGQLAWDFFELFASFPPSPTLADWGYLAFVPAFIAGLLVMGTWGKLSRVLMSLDTAALTCAFAVFFVTLFWPDIQRSPLAYPGKVTGLLYPICYATLTCAVFLVPGVGTWRNLSVQLLLLGLAGQVIAFLLWTPATLAGTFSDGGVIDWVWMGSMLLIAAGALCFKEFPPVESESQMFGPLALFPLVLSAGAILVRLADFERADMSHGLQWTLSGLVGMLFVLTAFRSALTLWRSGRLFRQAQESAEALRASEQRFRAIFHGAPIGIEIADKYGRLIHTNAALQTMLGYSAEELHEMDFADITHPDDVAAEVALDDEIVAGKMDQYQLEKRHLRKDGTALWTRLTASVVKDTHGEAQFAVGMVEDISERKRAEDALMHQAMHDSLTELPNRALLRDRLEQAVLLANRNTSACALLLMDLDRFKEINDTFGHHYGDALLQQIAARLVGVLRESDTVARLGGDEFAVVLPEAGERDAVQVADKIVCVLSQPIQVFGQSLPIDVSVGIALYPGHGQDVTTLMRHADIAMYLAKRAGTQVALYELGQDQQTQRRIMLVGALRQAIEHDQLLLHYQPKVDCRTGALIAVEALVRWQHPVHGLIRPDEFIPLAEHTGLVKPLTRWVLGESLRQSSQWRSNGLEIRIEVNLSARTLHDQDLPVLIEDLLSEWQAEPSWLGVEITESAVMADADRALDVLRQLDDMGVLISIDDFGTGYSSLGYLKRLPVTEIKIDRSFVMGMVADGNNRSIVRATIGLAHDLDLKVVAEGVESQESWNLLDALGCDLIQGYYVSPPLPASDLTAWIKEREQQNPLTPHPLWERGRIPSWIESSPLPEVGEVPGVMGSAATA